MIKMLPMNYWRLNEQTLFNFSSVYMDETMSGKEMQSWTKGYVLKYYNHTACAYEVVTVDDRDYMIIEWKSGDYRWGGHDTNYYVFVRE